MATALSAFVNSAMLSYRLRQQVGAFDLWHGNGRIVLCSLVAAVAAGAIDVVLAHERLFLSQALRFGVVCGTYGGLVLGLAYLLHVEAIFSLMKKSSPVPSDED